MGRVTDQGRRVAVFAPYLVIVVAGFFAAYYQVFTSYAPQDDEGFVLLTFDQFMGGGSLYGDVYAQYGPFFYELYSAIFGALGLTGGVALLFTAGAAGGVGSIMTQLARQLTSIDVFSRGRLVPGMRADVNLIDFDRLQLHKPELVHDMPANGRRFVQRVEGYQATLAAGIPIFERGEHTGAMPGRLVRASHNGHR